MATAKKVAWAQLKIGILALVALFLVVLLVFLLTGTKRIFGSDALLYTYVDDSGAMTQGSPVRLNGVLIGSVRAIELSGESTPRREIRMVMAVDPKMLAQIPSDSQAIISSENLLGSKFINIRKGRGKRPVAANAEIPSVDTSSIEDVTQSAYSTLAALQGTVKRVDSLLAFVESGEGSLGKLIKDDELYRRILSIAADVQKLSNALSSDQGTIGKLIYDPTLYQQLRTSLARVDSIVADLQDGKGSAGKLLKDPALYDDTHKSVVEVKKALEDLNAGKGTAGKLLKSDELHKQLQATIGRIDTMLDKVNSGQGTLGQLLVNQQLYESLNGASVELKGLLTDFRTNPKKFLRIKLGLF